MMKKLTARATLIYMIKMLTECLEELKSTAKDGFTYGEKTGICRVSGNHTIMGGIGKQRIGLRNRRAVSAVIDIVFIDKRHLPWYTVSDI